MPNVTAKVQPEVAHRLIRSGMAEPAVGNRADPTTVSVLFEVIGATANLLTIAVSSLTLPAVVRELVRADHEDEAPDNVKFRLSTKRNGREFTVDVSGSEEAVVQTIQAMLRG